jgi:soluble lytic murein transglycosylase
MEEKLAALRSARAGDPESTRRSLQSQLRLVESDADRKRLLAELRTVYAALPAYAPPKFKLVKLGRQAPIGKKRNTPSRVSDELLFLGLSDEAAPEVDAGRSSKPAARADFDFTLATFYMLGDNAGEGVAFVESAWKTPADHQIELLPNDISRMLYPAPYADIIVKYTNERSLDPRFLLALMRQESGFRTDVRSSAAARGLMQFTPSTATRIAGEIGDESFRQSDLYDPHVAIRFASEYAGNLFQLFPNQTEAVVGSYNGGEDNMKRWMGRAKSDQPERYVPEIMFSQTKEYVLRVMANYRVYKLLYDEKLRPH